MISAVDLLDRDEVNGLYGVPRRHTKGDNLRGWIYLNVMDSILKFLEDSGVE